MYWEQEVIEKKWNEETKLLSSKALLSIVNLYTYILFIYKIQIKVGRRKVWQKEKKKVLRKFLQPAMLSQTFTFIMSFNQLFYFSFFFLCTCFIIFITFENIYACFYLLLVLFIQFYKIQRENSRKRFIYERMDGI